MRILLATALAAFTAICAPVHEQHSEFKGFKIERGVYTADPGWKFEPQGDAYLHLLANESGDNSEPCDCALETGGSCDQATLNGDITEIRCVDNGCGFCVRGTTVDPTIPILSSDFAWSVSNRVGFRPNVSCLLCVLVSPHSHARLIH
jgi:hypothetical protein